MIGGGILKIDDDKIEWELFNQGSGDAVVERIEIAWPAGLGAIDKIKLDGDEIVKNDLPPSSAVVTSFEKGVKERTIEAGKDATFKVEFTQKLKGTLNDDYTIRINFVGGGSVIFTPAPICDISGENVLKIDDDKIEWELLSRGSGDVVVERIEIAWPAGLGAVEKIKLDGAEIVKDDLPPSSAVVTSFEKDEKDRTIESGKEAKLKVEFEEKLKSTVNADYMIRIEFVEGCAVEYVAVAGSALQEAEGGDVPMGNHVFLPLVSGQ